MGKRITIILPSIMIIIGLMFYAYYDVYKMLFVNIGELGYDFKLAFDTAQNYCHGYSIYANPYNTPPYLYPPLSILAFLPFRNCTFSGALTIWFILTHVLMICSCWIIYNYGSQHNRLNSAAAAIFTMFLSMPIHINIFIGNINILVFFLICLIYKFIISDRKFIIPWIIAICTYIKIFPILLVVSFSRRQHFKVIKYSVAAVLILGILSVIALGMEEQINFLKTLAKGFDWVGPSNHSTSLTFILKLFLPNSYQHIIIINFINLAMGIFLLSLWWIRSKRQIETEIISTLVVDVTLMIIIAILLFPSSRLFYNEFFIVPFYFIFFAWLQGSRNFKYFNFFLIIFFLISFWEIIMYQIPIGQATMREIWFFRKDDFPILFPFTSALPFILNLAFFFWVIINYDRLIKSLNFLDGKAHP